MLVRFYFDSRTALYCKRKKAQKKVDNFLLDNQNGISQKAITTDLCRLISI